ncbi:MAG: hypothetical protein BGN92_09730 [Sphingobacteriales bacterium 41-5]|nr:MAG: hypothetical protein BGN92_09730 [Sphingobacteriales bacterium 41-5]
MIKNDFLKKVLLPFLVAALYIISPVYAQKARLVVPKGHDNIITATCISDNQKYLATTSRNTIIIWDLIKEKELHRVKTQDLSINDQIKKLHFIDDNKVIIVNSIDAYNIFTGEKLSGFEESALKQVSPNGKYYLEISEKYPDVTISVIENNNDKKVNSITIAYRNFKGFTWNKNEILFYGPDTWTIFDVVQNKKNTVSLSGKSYDIATADFNNNRIALIERYRDEIGIYDLNSGKLVKTKKATGQIYNVFFKENKLIAFQSELNPQKKESFYIVQYDKDGNQLKKTETILSGESTFFAENVFNSSANNLVYNEGGKLKIYNIFENIIRDAFTDKIAYYNSFAFPKIINQQHFKIAYLM